MKNRSQKIKISIYGARHSNQANSFDSLEKAQQLGEAAAKEGAIVTIPATRGFPYWVAKGAKKEGGYVVGFSPAANEYEHVEVYHLPLDYTDITIYSGFGFAGSDLLLSRSSDAVIFGYGGLETVHEFWVAFQEDKPIGILKGEWDTDEILFGLLKGNEAKFDHRRIIFDDDPQRLARTMVQKAKEYRIQSHHLKK